MLKILFVLFSLSAFAQTDYSRLDPFPCREPQSNRQINLTNSDDLYYSGRFLVRAGRELEGIQCLNLGKKIAPAYLDIRLELVYAFVEIGDERSARLEAEEFLLFPSNSYYFYTYLTYRRKIDRIYPSQRSIPGYSFEALPMVDAGNEYRVLNGEEIQNEEFLKEVVTLKHQSRFVEARALLDTKVIPFNPESATVFMYSGLVYYDLNQPALAEKDLKIALTSAYNEPDVILSVSRALNGQGKFQASYKILKSNIAYFSDYGCFQLGSALQKVFDATDARSAVKLKKVLMDSLYNETTGSELCREIEAKFF